MTGEGARRFRRGLVPAALTIVLVIAVAASWSAAIMAGSADPATEQRDLFTPLVGVASALTGGLIGTVSSWLQAQRVRRDSLFVRVAALIKTVDDVVALRRQAYEYLRTAGNRADDEQKREAHAKGERADELIPLVESQFYLIGEVRNDDVRSELTTLQKQFDRLKAAALASDAVLGVDTAPLAYAARRHLSW